jgi:endonuclease/exonuclease/phosphatase family metal-dependent hydrolase
VRPVERGSPTPVQFHGRAEPPRYSAAVRRSRRVRRRLPALVAVAAALVGLLWSGTRGERPGIPPSSPFHSRAACEAYLKRRPARTGHGPRIGTWNVRWFPYGASRERDSERATDVAWLACAIAALDVDVLAVQEFVQDPGGRNALADLRERLDRLTHGRYRSEFDSCPASGFQHVGFLFDTRRVRMSPARELAALNPGRSACDRSLRPGVGLYARFASGPDLHLVSVHLDSGMVARDFAHRQAFPSALSQVQRELLRDEPDTDLLVLGDFNSMGCDGCSPKVSAAEELRALDAQLSQRSFERLPLPAEQPCTHYFRGRSSVLDHIVARAGMDEIGSKVRVEVHGPCRELACERSSSSVLPAFERLSDHCPLVVELLPVDRD